MSNPTQPQGFPQQPGGPGMVPPPAPPKKRKWVKWVILAVVAILIIWGIGSCVSAMNSVVNGPQGVVASPDDEPADKPAEEDSKPADDKPTEEAEPYTIKATECKRGDYGQVDVKVKVTNNTKQKRTYFFDIAVEDTDGNTVGTGLGSISNVKPGKTGTAAVYASMTDEEYKGKIKCVIDVTNFSDS